MYENLIVICKYLVVFALYLGMTNIGINTLTKNVDKINTKKKFQL